MLLAPLLAMSSPVWAATEKGTSRMVEERFVAVTTISSISSPAASAGRIRRNHASTQNAD